MQLNITGHHLDVTTSIKSYIETKFERLQKHFDHMTNIHVVLTVEKDRQKAEATIHVINFGDLFAQEEHDDMYVAIDRLCDKLDRQLTKHKEKLTDHHRGNKGSND